LKDIADSDGGLDDPRIARAEDALRRALEINAGIPEAWEGRGFLALMRHDCPGAAVAFQRAGSRQGSPVIERLLQRCER
jgi:hypothetical protein